MNKASWLAAAFAVLGWFPAQAADKPSASMRVYLYQREARAVLAARGWHVSHDENGRLVADHPLGPLGAPASGSSVIGLTSHPPPANSPFHAYAWLTLSFQPESLSRTKCAASIVGYEIWEGMKKGDSKPFAFANPDTTKEIQDVMAKAEQALAAKHPEYAPK